MYEIERKFKITPAEYIILQTKLWYLHRPVQKQSSDPYIDIATQCRKEKVAQKDYFLYKDSQRLLRLREEKETSGQRSHSQTLTFKTIKKGEKFEKEWKIPFKIPNFLLKSFKNYQKTRIEFNLRLDKSSPESVNNYGKFSYIICLDETPWGHFVELEFLTPQTSSREIKIHTKNFKEIIKLLLDTEKKFAKFSYSDKCMEK